MIEVGEGPTVSARWDGIEHVDTTPTHMFVYVGRAKAFIAPRTIGEPRIESLLGEIEAHRTHSA